MCEMVNHTAEQYMYVWSIEEQACILFWITYYPLHSQSKNGCPYLRTAIITLRMWRVIGYEKSTAVFRVAVPVGIDFT